MLTAPPNRLPAALEAVSAAVRSDRVTALAATLAELLRSGALDGESMYVPPRPDRYSRNLIWRDPAARFVMIGMSWAPGQGSALHDHDGLWGAEIVVDGTMRETRYHLAARDGASRYRFTDAQTRECARGSVGVLAPPLEYHRFGNAGDSIARTVHVYCGDLTKAQLFTRETGEWYRAEPIDLRYDG